MKLYEDFNVSLPKLSLHVSKIGITMGGYSDNHVLCTKEMIKESLRPSRPLEDVRVVCRALGP